MLKKLRIKILNNKGITVCLIVCMFFVLLSIIALLYFDTHKEELQELFSQNLDTQEQPEAIKIDPVHFLAVGDNLPEQEIGNAGLQPDGTYNYDFVYKNVKPYVEKADLSLITSETCLGGNEIGIKGWPSFNSRDEFADAIQNAGFDVAALASNHTYDYWIQAAEHCIDVWKTKNVVTLGIDKTQQEADNIRTKTIKGVKFAFLDYTYAVNAYEESDFQPWQISFFNEAKIIQDAARARSCADVVVAFAHWGTELVTEINSMQEKYGQLLADCGVDIVVGSHPHIIQPMTWLTGKNGNQTLVAYSLGNFNSNFASSEIKTQAEGMLECDISKEDDKIKISNVTWVPLINHNEAGNYTVYALQDYTPELASRHPFLKSNPNAIDYIKQFTAGVVNALGNNFSIAGINEISNTNKDTDNEPGENLNGVSTDSSRVISHGNQAI